MGLRDYQDAKADVILKYNADEARNLKTYGEIPETVKVTDTVNFVDDGLDDDIEFGDDSGSGEDDDINDIWTPHLGFTILVHNENKALFGKYFSIATFHSQGTLNWVSYILKKQQHQHHQHIIIKTIFESEKSISYKQREKKNHDKINTPIRILFANFV